MDDEVEWEPGRCEWCGISLTWWERLLRRWYCPDCRKALTWDRSSAPFPFQSRRNVCRKYLRDHDDYCPGHHAEAYP